MNYEQFLFTRNKRRDFMAFVRPADMTNKEVSLIASAFNYITDVAALTSEQPGLYCFPLGAYTFVLRHYDSGRKHAGREIGIIEGLAIRADEADSLAQLLAEIVERQTELLEIAGDVKNIEEIEVGKSEALSLTATFSPEEIDVDSVTPAMIEHDLLEELEPEEETKQLPVDDLLVDVAARMADEQLVLPFNDGGRGLLIEALKMMRSKPLHFAFGTNSDVIGRLAESGIDFDVIGLFSATEATFRARAAKQRPAAKVAALHEPEAVEPSTPTKREHHSLLGKLVGWLLGR